MSINERRDIDNSQSNSNVLCNIWGRGITTNRGLLLQLNACQRKQGQQNQQLEENDDQENTYRLQDMPRKPVNEPFYWNEKPGTTFINKLNNAYEKIVYWKKKQFLLPTRAAGKIFINEMTWMINAWVYNTLIKNIALKVLHVMPALLLRKPSKNYQSKDPLKSLERRFEKWKEGRKLQRTLRRRKSNSRSAVIRWKSRCYNENIEEVQISNAKS